MFGEYVKSIRSERRLGLREFCINAQCDASNWSKVEREVLAPPQDVETLRRVAGALGVEQGSEEWERLVDYAAIGAGKIPEYVLEDAALVRKLPLFFRTVSGKKPSREELEKLAQILRDP